MRKSNSVKLSDIAEKTGVSQSTVSRVLNNQPGISDATRGAVLSKLREFGLQLRGMKQVSKKEAKAAKKAEKAARKSARELERLR